MQDNGSKVDENTHKNTKCCLECATVVLFIEQNHHLKQSKKNLLFQELSQNLSYFIVFDCISNGSCLKTLKMEEKRGFIPFQIDIIWILYLKYSRTGLLVVIRRLHTYSAFILKNTTLLKITFSFLWQTQMPNLFLPNPERGRWVWAPACPHSVQSSGRCHVFLPLCQGQSISMPGQHGKQAWRAAALFQNKKLLWGCISP